MDMDEVREDLRQRLKTIKAKGQSGPEGLSAALDQDPEEKVSQRIADGLFLFDRGMAGEWATNKERGDGSGAKPRRGREVYQDVVLRPEFWADWHILKWKQGRVAAYTILRRDQPEGDSVLDLGQSLSVFAAQFTMIKTAREYRAAKDARAAAEWGSAKMTQDREEWLRYETNPRAWKAKAKIQEQMMRALAKDKGWI